MILVDIGRVTQFPAMTDRPLLSTVDPTRTDHVVVEAYADRPEPMQFALERLARHVARKRIEGEERRRVLRDHMGDWWARRMREVRCVASPGVQWL